MTSTRDPQLRTHLRQFVKEAMSRLRELGELPRPLSAPLEIARSSWLEPELRKLASYQALHKYLATSGIAQKLSNAGHGWIWHGEVFPWLFIEQFINSAPRDTYDPGVFKTIYRRVESEIFSETVTLRRVRMIHGIPLPTGKIHLEKGLTLVRHTFEESHEGLPDLLWLRFQPRPLDSWISGKGALLVNDVKARKEDDGRAILRHQDAASEDESLCLLAMRLSCDSFIHPGPLFQVQLSRFPLWPPRRWDPEESRVRHHESGRHLTRLESRRLRLSRTALKRVLDPALRSHDRAPALLQALVRFQESFRLVDQESNIVDLMVALEALYLPQPGPELRYRLATNVGNLLGRSDEHRLSIYDQIRFAYGIRNTLVHGRKKFHKDLRDQVRKFLSAAGMATIQVRLPRDVAKVAWRLRQVVRESICAYFRVTQAFDSQPKFDRWPDTDAFDKIRWDAKARRKFQDLAGISKP